MNTYLDLYNTLLLTNNIKEYIHDKSIGNIDKLEAIFKLFSFLKLFNNFNNYDICTGNYNISTITTVKDNKILFNLNLGGKGDKSDLTLLSKDKKTIIATTVKNYNYSYGINDLDIRDISDIYNKNYKPNNYKLILCIVIPNKEYLYKIANCSNNTSKDIKDIILDSNTIIYDLNDIYETFNHFKYKYSTNLSINSLYNNKELLILYPHQKYAVNKIIKLLNTTNNILLGPPPRSGKSYIMCGVIIENNDNNILIITTAPNETIPEYLKLFNNKIEFDNYTIITRNDIKDKKKPKLGNKNIIIISKQYLQSKTEKTNKIKWLNEIDFTLRFIDETHNGGTTELAKTTLDMYGNNSKTIYITATYTKPIYNYNINNQNCVLWDLEDNNLCKNIRVEENYNKLITKHGDLLKTVINEYDLNNIEKYYNTIPKLHYITWKLNDEIKKDLLNDDYGISIDSILMLKNDGKKIENKFMNEDMVEKLIKNIFGYEKKQNYSYYDKNSFFGRIKNIIDKPEYSSRWFNKTKPLTILSFLPCGNGVDILAETLKTFIINKNLLDEFEIITLTNTNDKKPIELINDAENKAIINGKIGVLVLTGKRCSLGITIKNCDIVLLLTNINQYDTIFQMLYRCMSEDENKSCGFVIDLNIQRSVNIIMEYAININKNKSSKDALKYILEQKLINFNVDEWNDTIFGVRNTNINEIITSIYKIFSSKTSNSITKILENIDYKINLFSVEDQKLITSLFTININKGKKKISNILENEDININDGIDKNKKNNKESSKDKNEEDYEREEENLDLFNEIIKKLAPLLALFTVCENDCISFDKMIEFIKENEELSPIILDTIKTWWGNKMNLEVFNIFIMLYDKYLKHDNKFNTIVADIKQIFKENLGNIDDLSKSIDKYLIPHENEKKQNAEVSTPYELRIDMLDKIPEDFWKSPKKVFEPCSGKCGFVIDIINKFMNGLKDLIENKEERYKFIIEDCLYYSDINKQNIFISKLLLDPYKKYKLNFNEGDTLKLNIKEKWDLEGFDLVVGNPPYENINATGDNKLYLQFIEYSINILLENKYLLFITPINIKNYITNQNKNRSYIHNYMNIKYLSLNSSNKYFKNISTYFCYFLIQKKIVKYSKTKVDYLRKNIIEYDDIIINENDILPLCISNNDINLINKVSNLIKNNYETFDIKKALYIKNDKKVLQRIRLTHIKNGNIKENEDEIYKYKIIDKINIKNQFPGIYYYNNNKMIDYGISKIIMCSGGYLMPSFDEKGEYNLSDNMIYLLINNYEEYNGLKILINSKLIKYLNKISMTDNIHGRDIVIQSMKKINLSNIKNEDDIYKIYDITDNELFLINNTI